MIGVCIQVCTCKTIVLLETSQISEITVARTVNEKRIKSYFAVVHLHSGLLYTVDSHRCRELGRSKTKI